MKVKKIIEYFSVILVILFTSSASTASRSDIFLVFSLIFIGIISWMRLKTRLIVSVSKFLFYFIILLITYYLKNREIDYYTWIGVFCKLLLAYFTVLYSKENFVDNFIKVILVGVLISFLMFSLQLFDYKTFFNINNIFGTDAARDGLDPISSSIVFNTIEIHKFRNSGFMWEPGAFAAVMIFALTFSFFQRNFVDKEKVILIVGILTTFSTMGYIVMFMILFFFIYIRYKSIAIIMIIPIAIIMLNLDFLFNKIVDQWQFAQTDILRVEKSSNFDGAIGLTRFASILIDINIVLNNPILGLGFDINTVGWDKFYGETGGDKVVRASGIMFSLVKTGILGTTLYFIFLYKSIKRYYCRIKFSGLFYCFIVLCVLLSNPIDYSTLMFCFLFLPNLKMSDEKKKINL